MIEPQIISNYLNLSPLGSIKEYNDNKVIIPNGLDVNYYDGTSHYAECILNTGSFNAQFIEEKKTGVFKQCGLLLLNSLNFDLSVELQMFKKYSGVVDLSYAAGLYIGGLYNLMKHDLQINQNENALQLVDGSMVLNGIGPQKAIVDTELSYEAPNEDGYASLSELAITTNFDLKKSKLKIDINSTIASHAYGVGNKIYNEWTDFIKNYYLQSDTSTIDTKRISNVQYGNWAGEIKSFYSGVSNFNKVDYGEDKKPQFLATYSVLNTDKNFSEIFKANKTTDINYLQDYIFFIAHVKYLVKTNKSEKEIKATIKEYFNKSKGSVVATNHIKNILSKYGTVGNFDTTQELFPNLKWRQLTNNVVITDVMVDKVVDDVYNSLKHEVSKHINLLNSDFSIVLYPSAGGFFSPARLLNEKGDQTKPFTKLMLRSLRFVWCQSNISKRMDKIEPLSHNNINRTLSPFKKFQTGANNVYASYGKKETDIKTIQDIINIVGLHNLEYLEKEFLDWVDVDAKGKFDDKFHFTSLLKAITILEAEDFTDVKGRNGTLYTPEKQMAMLDGYNYIISKELANEFLDTSYLLNAFLTNAQHEKIKKVTESFLQSRIAVNNYTTIGLLKSGDVSLLLENAPFRRELIFSDNELLYHRFLVRKALLGDQDIPFFDISFDAIDTVAKDANHKVNKLILKYFNFTIPTNSDPKKQPKEFNRVDAVLRFCHFIKVAPTEDILRVLHPIIGSYMYFTYIANKGDLAKFCDKLLIQLYAKNSLNIYLAEFKKRLNQYTDKKDQDYLLSLTTDDKDNLTDLKTGTYYNIRAMFDNNIYAPNKTFFSSDKEVKYTDQQGFLDQPMFYNYNKAHDCGETKTLDHDTSGERPKHLYEYVQVLDRGNKDIGYDLLANIMWINDYLKIPPGEDLTNNSTMDQLVTTTYFSFFSKFASEHNCLLHPLSSYINLAGTNTDADAYFGVYKNLEMVQSSPAFIIQYIGDMESILSTKENKETIIGGSQISPQNSFCMDVDATTGKVKTENAPKDVVGGDVSCFVVDFGAQNQQVFKNIQIDTSQFTNTEEGIKSFVNLTSQKNQQPASGDLFKILSQRSYNCTVEALGNVMIQPLSYFYIKNIPLFTGSYWIVNVSHKLEANVINTSFRGVRQPIAKIPNKNQIMLSVLNQNIKTIDKTETSVTENEVSNVDTNKFFTYSTVKSQFLNLNYSSLNVNVKNKQNLNFVMKYLQQTGGLTFMQAAIVTGNLITESGLNPKVDVIDSNKKYSFGLAQWNGVRRTAVHNYLNKKFNNDWQKLDDKILIEAELEFLLSEKQFKDNKFIEKNQVGDAIYTFAQFEAFSGYDKVEKMKYALVNPNSPKSNYWGTRVQNIARIMKLGYNDIYTEISGDAGNDLAKNDGEFNYNFSSGRFLPKHTKAPAREAEKKNISPYLCIIHTAESDGDGTQLANDCVTNSDGRRWHFSVGNTGKVFWHLPYDVKGSHIKGINSKAIGIEHAGKSDVTDWKEREAQLRASAQIVADFCVYLKKAPSRDFIIGHKEGKKYGSTSTHTDPGTTFPWDKYMSYVNEYYKKTNV